MAGAGGHRGSVWLFAVIVAFAMLGALIPAAAGAATASWAFEPGAWNFGTVMPGAAATAPVPFTLRNTGEVPLTPAFISLDEGEGGRFGFNNWCHATLDPGASCTVEVTFRATESGPQEATLELFGNNGGAPPAVVHLSGSGAAGTVSIDQPTLDFGTVELGTGIPPTRTATVTNTSSLEVEIEELQYQLLSGGEGEPLPGPFGSPGLNTCHRGVVLPAGGSCTITETFGPRTVGPAAAELRLVDDAADSPQVIHLSGTGFRRPLPPPFVPPPPPPAVPAATLGSHPPARTRSRDATFSFSGNATTKGFFCSLDRGVAVPCTSPTHYGSLKPGIHLFQVRATGDSGTQTLGVSWSWTITKKPAHKKRRHHKRRSRGHRRVR
jgi:hypothetical protein